jgi:hypothetical protein
MALSRFFNFLAILSILIVYHEEGAFEYRAGAVE